MHFLQFIMYEIHCCYFPDGTLEQLCYYNSKGRYHGEYKEWYENGNLSIHCFYKNGQRHGEYKSWYLNGKLEIHFFCKNGERHGELKKLHLVVYENGCILKWL